VLDREDVGIVGGLLDERLHGRPEGVVGVVDEHVSGPHGRQHVVPPARALQLTLGGSLVGRVLQVRPVECVDLPEARQVEQGARRVDVLAAERELVLEQHAYLVLGSRFDLEAYRVVHPQPSVQPRLDRGEQVVRLAFVEEQVGVPGDAEGVGGDDVRAREERAQLGPDELLDRQQAFPVAEGDETRKHRRHLHPGETAPSRLPVADHDAEIQREIRDPRERMGRVHRQGRQRRMDLAPEPLLELLLLAGTQRVPVREADALRRERRDQGLGEDAFLPAHQPLGGQMDRLELLGRAAAVGGIRDHAGFELDLEAGHPNLEELVEIGRADRAELDPLEERLALVLGQGQDAFVECQPRELAVEEAVRSLRADRLRPLARLALLRHASSVVLRAVGWWLADVPPSTARAGRRPGTDRPIAASV
jgi:hypothetical protein